MRFTSWSPTRLASYEECPAKARWKDLEKLCPLCFDGTVKGGYDSPAVCDTCKQTIEKGPALTRGTEIGRELELYVKGEIKALKRVANSVAAALAKRLRAEYKKGRVQVEEMIALNAKWRRVSNFAKDVWFRGKLDVLRFTGTGIDVIDWKTGGIDKRTGEIRATPEKYEDQLSIYQTAALAVFPDQEEAAARLVFVDATGNPVVKNLTLTRDGLKLNMEHWEKRALPMLSDDTFAPRPSADACRFCDYRKDKGGPCKF